MALHLGLSKAPAQRRGHGALMRGAGAPKHIQGRGGLSQAVVGSHGSAAGRRRLQVSATWRSQPAGSGGWSGPGGQTHGATSGGVSTATTTTTTYPQWRSTPQPAPTQQTAARTATPAAAPQLSRQTPSVQPLVQHSTALTAGGGSSALATADLSPAKVSVRFWLKYKADYGQVLRVTGGHEAFGAWNLAKAPVMSWTEGDLWMAETELTSGSVYEYKYVVLDYASGAAVSWQRGGNNVLALQLGDGDLEVYDNWTNAPGSMVINSKDGVEMTRERKLLSWAGDMEEQRLDLRRTRQELAKARDEIRALRAEVSVLRLAANESGGASEANERRIDLEKENQELRLQLAASKGAFQASVKEAVRLLSEGGALPANFGAAAQPAAGTSSAYSAAAGRAGAAAGSAAASNGNGSGNGSTNGNGRFAGLNLGGMLGGLNRNSSSRADGNEGAGAPNGSNGAPAGGADKGAPMPPPDNRRVVADPEPELSDRWASVIAARRQQQG